MPKYCCNELDEYLHLIESTEHKLCKDGLYIETYTQHHKIWFIFTFCPFCEEEFSPQPIAVMQWNKNGKDCRKCKWQNDRMVYCQAAQCPSGPNDGNGFHAFEPEDKVESK